MYHILVVDDESRIRALIRKYAEFEGHTVTEAGDGMEAVNLCRTQTFDLIIMDIMMPELDGFSACREIRKISQTPIIMLSARGEEYDKTNGFELGIDDYVVKPFSPKELMLRVDAVMKRVKRPVADTGKAPNQIIELDGGGLKADVTARIVYVDGQRVDMSPKEYDLFCWRTGTSRSRGKSSSVKCGGTIFTVMPARWIHISSCCAKSSASMPPTL